VSSSGFGEQHRPQRPAAAEQHLGDRLSAFVDGELTGDTRDRVLAHLATCPQCKAAAADQRRLKSVVAGSELPAISAGLLARLQGLPGMSDIDGPDGGPPRPPADSADAAGSTDQQRRGPFDGGRFGSFGSFGGFGSRPSVPELPDPDLSGSGLRTGAQPAFSYLGPAEDLVPAADDGPRGRGFRIHDSASRGRRFAFAAAGAFSMAAIAIGSALPMEAAMDGGARPDDGPAVSPLTPLSAGQVSDTRGTFPRGVIDAESEHRSRHESAVVVASATSMALARPLLAPGVLPLDAGAQDAPATAGTGSVVLH